MTSKLNSMRNKFKNIKTKIASEFEPLIIFAKALYKRRNLFKIILALAVAATIFSYGFIEFEHQSKIKMLKAIKFHQAVMVNIENNEVFSGSYYKDIIEVPNQYVPPAPLEDLFKPKAPETTSLRQRTLNDQDKEKAKIAIVVVNLGLSKSNTLNALELPKNFTMGFSPYANEIDTWVKQATDKGFEVLMNLPLQPSDYPVNDPGPYALLNNLSNGENLSRLDWVLARSDKIVGLYSSPNDSFFSSLGNVNYILSELKKKQLIFSYGNAINHLNFNATAKLTEAQFVSADLIIDNELNPNKILSNMFELEKIAQSTGSAVGYVSSSPGSIEVIKSWLSELDTNKTVVVSISNFFEDPRAFSTLTKLNDKIPNCQDDAHSVVKDNKTPAQIGNENHLAPALATEQAKNHE